MDNKPEGTVEEREKRYPLYETTRKLMLAAIGAAAIATEEIESFVNRMVERGELAERDARKLAEEMKQKRDQMMEEHRAARAYNRNAASKEEVEALQMRVAELTRQLDELTRSQGGGTQA